MMKCVLKDLGLSAMSIVFGCAAASLAHAQEPTPPLPFTVPPPGSVIVGGAVGVAVVPRPPAGFDPLTASPAANAQYHVPPRPDPAAAPAAYAKWQKAVGGPVMSGKRDAPDSIQLTPTNIFNGPVRNVGSSTPYVSANASPENAPEPGNAIVSTTSSNWSGNAVYNSSDVFAVEAIIGEFVVPAAHQAFGACTGGWDWS
jgi:hypothetical protein